MQIYAFETMYFKVKYISPQRFNILRFYQVCQMKTALKTKIILSFCDKIATISRPRKIYSFQQKPIQVFSADNSEGESSQTAPFSPTIQSPLCRQVAIEAPEISPLFLPLFPHCFNEFFFLSLIFAFVFCSV